MYSLILQLGFVRLNSIDDLPSEIWVSIAGRLSIKGDATAENLTPSDDFFDQRASALATLYPLLGQLVAGAALSDKGSLQIDVGGKRICVDAEEAELEEVWSVTSDSPDASVLHRWQITLDDCGALAVHTPAN